MANPGVFFHTTHGAASTPVQSAMGWLCIASTGIFRVVPTQLTGGTAAPCDGHFLIDFNAYFAAQLEDSSLLAGASLDLQAWYRDPPSPGRSNLTDALSFTMLP